MWTCVLPIMFQSKCDAEQCVCECNAHKKEANEQNADLIYGLVGQSLGGRDLLRVVLKLHRCA